MESAGAWRTHNESFARLIEAGYHLADSGSDSVAVRRWSQRAFALLTATVGGDHVYTKYFEDFIKEGGKNGIMAVGGLLSAAREQANSPWSGQYYQ